MYTYIRTYIHVVYLFFRLQKQSQMSYVTVLCLDKKDLRINIIVKFLHNTETETTTQHEHLWLQRRCNTTAQRKQQIQLLINTFNTVWH